MTRENLRYQTKDGIATITLARPDVLNSMNTALARELQQVLDEAAGASDVRALLLTGEGRAFCAGQDLAEVVPPDGSKGPELRSVIDQNYNPIVRRIVALEKPVVCAVNGVAAGAGANLALCCDIVLAEKNASFLQAFVNIGLIPDSGGTYFLPRLLGLPRAKALMMLGERIPAEQALAFGLIWAVHEPERLLPEAQALAAKLAAMPTLALGLIKRATNASLEGTLASQLDLERDLQALAGQSYDYAEGVKAFQEKRKPRFLGR